MASGESSAIQILKRAVELDNEKKYGESIACYEQGISILFKASKGKDIAIKLVYSCNRTILILTDCIERRI